MPVVVHRHRTRGHGVFIEHISASGMDLDAVVMASITELQVIGGHEVPHIGDAHMSILSVTAAIKFGFGESPRWLGISACDPNIAGRSDGPTRADDCKSASGLISGRWRSRGRLMWVNP